MPTNSIVLLFLHEVLSSKLRDIYDIQQLYNKKQFRFSLSLQDVLAFCTDLGLMEQNEDSLQFRLSPEVVDCLGNKEEILQLIAEKSFGAIFGSDIENLLVFDSDIGKYIFNNPRLPTRQGYIRNCLIDCGILCLDKQSNKSRIIVGPEYFGSLNRAGKRRLHPDSLRGIISSNGVIGEMAEQFVLKYESSRLEGKSCVKLIQQVSLVDVCAGFDIASFDSGDSCHFDRFIEVKAVGDKPHFYWSKNEIDVANQIANRYYLYLVNVNQISCPSYEPQIVQNPTGAIFKSGNWLVRSEKYSIHYIGE